MPPPDWGRVLTVDSRAQSAERSGTVPLGDPIRWGGSREMLYSSFAPEVSSDTIFRAQANDTYGRLWSAQGTVAIRQGVWALALPAADFGISLEVTMGVGQARTIVEFDLRLLTTIGLTVYRPRLFTRGAPGAGVYEQRPFAIVGGMMGQALEARVIIRTSLAAGLALEQAQVNVMIAPLAAGAGL